MNWAALRDILTFLYILLSWTFISYLLWPKRIKRDEGTFVNPQPLIKRPIRYIHI